MFNFYNLAKPFIFSLDPEKAHTLSLKALKSGIFPACPAVKDERLEVSLWGLTFSNPVGLSAGFDKNAEIIGPALRLGFGFVEAGTVTPKPQSGNPKPRVFRDPGTESVINALGFPNVGGDVFKQNLLRFLDQRYAYNGVVGLNLGMNKDQENPVEDYRHLIRILGPLADYVTVNISSPNTPGLRDLQRREPLLALLGHIKEERQNVCSDSPPPLLVKLAPDLDETQQQELAETLVQARVDGIILTNTTLDRPSDLPSSFAQQKGGLSGRLLKEKSNAVLKNFYQLTQGKIPLIGVGGISSGTDAYERIRAGASLIQLYTALVFQGPGVANSINRDLLHALDKDGYQSIADAVGADVDL